MENFPLIPLKKIKQIEAFGYTTLEPYQVKNQYFPEPNITEIEEVIITRPTFKNTYKIGKLKNSNVYFESRFKPWIIAKKMKQEKPSNHPFFIKSINFIAKVYVVPKATIKINVYTLHNGLPNEIIYSEVVTCKKGKHKNKHILPNPISFPKEGVIVGFEWIFNKKMLMKLLRFHPVKREKKLSLTIHILLVLKRVNQTLLLVV